MCMNCTNKALPILVKPRCCSRHDGSMRMLGYFTDHGDNVGRVNGSDDVVMLGMG